jgi:hypothetical protein
MKIEINLSEYHVLILALQEYGTAWMAAASAAARDRSTDASLAMERGDAAFALLRRLREAKAQE